MKDSIKTDAKNVFEKNQLMNDIIDKFFDTSSTDFGEEINKYVEEKVNEIN
ncbi:hypothetical protein KO361_02120 [Candidatus Woesearchaeota archaeon]|nr:hypothetical protein [Candidatus Woesearchaeota archaeon]